MNRFVKRLINAKKIKNHFATVMQTKKMYFNAFLGIAWE